MMARTRSITWYLLRTFETWFPSVSSLTEGREEQPSRFFDPAAMRPTLGFSPHKGG